ncbi:response regulator transcription factor [Clostridium estertheticum]|uniref:Stage 0 sporulation protein A homolog n=1 Tax=Clostridium estertheticum subsp. estertheticum TaxID=1552 RepID=A0A1J0GF31_9CLOT|nr:response regulator transcription factor [Clostridium estertheticum]APC39907.1 DNA-binding response regulator [Clostridium estertheticum subsp. estertheticum]MBU3172418.1 response regulator transcription factor [Clostridium estertheticum]MBZ9614032.1 response regulator transcription factor [Clostridium estertheticum subsp. laramiense]MCB2340204.1 response regulator transcription factor [Clostridium estertheticum]WAG73985.1 response regulator transcription factor [Clostridium estertheticum]
MIDLVIVDDQEIVREGLKRILSLNEEINCIGEAYNGKQLIELLKKLSPQVILMDIRMPIMDGIEATKFVKENHPNIKVIILTTFDEDDYIFQGLKYGADGYILKDSGSKEIINSIKAALEGSIFLNPKITEKVVKALNSRPIENSAQKKNDEKEKLLQILTPREFDVAKHIIDGKSNKSISEALFVTEGTVKNYVSKILEKLQVNNRTELVIYLQKVF